MPQFVVAVAVAAAAAYDDGDGVTAAVAVDVAVFLNFAPPMSVLPMFSRVTSLLSS